LKYRERERERERERGLGGFFTLVMVLSNPKKHILIFPLSHSVISVISLFMLFSFSTGGGVFWKWVVFAEASTGSTGSGRKGWIVGGAGGGFWGAATAPSNVGIAIAVTAMAGIALAGTVVYSRR
jgi:hypothetical protein